MAKAKKKASKAETKVPEKSETTEEICETFDIEKDGKEQVKEACSLVEKKPASKEEIKRQNKTLRNILIALGILILLILLGVWYINSLRHFEYRGIKGDVVKEGKLIFYQIEIPIKVNGQKVTYSIFLRNNPEELDAIPFNGDMADFTELSRINNSYVLIINASDEFDCDDDELIAVGNMMNLKAIEFKMMKDENATCDLLGRYIYINMKKADVSEINQIGNACYELSIANCEILKVTERFMVEMIVKDKELRDYRED